MSDKIRDFRNFVDGNRFLDETYFVILSVVLAFGILQTLGTGLGTEKPVVTVISTSMCPALQVGDILVVKHQSFEEVMEDDIVVYDVPDTAEINVNGEDYLLRANDTHPDPSVKTSMGEVQLTDVIPSRDRSRDRVNIQVNGDRPILDGSETNLIEGESYQIGNGTLSVDYATSLPYSGVPIVHRVVDKEEDHIKTIGDNNPSQLEFETNVRPDQIHGTVFIEVPRIGLVKILAMDFLGYSGDQPFVLDNTPSC